MKTTLGGHTGELCVFNGVSLLESPLMVEDGPEIQVFYEVKRTWRERLFTRPWQPLRATTLEVRMEVSKVPMKSVIMHGTVMIMHPEIARIFKEESRGWLKS